MHIVVCTKHTPDSEAKMSVDEAGNVSWGESPLIINPWDEYAVEEALLLRDKHGGTVTVISMGPEEVLEALNLVRIILKAIKLTHIKQFC